jgi:hypothetical protein
VDGLFDPAATCLPSWRTRFLSYKGTVNSGCPMQASGDVPCDPERLRQNAYDQLKASGYLGLFQGLSLEAYTLGRYITAEVGSDSIEEQVVVGWAAINQAKLRGYASVNQLLLYLGPHGGRYGAIHGVGTGTTTAPYGRWASTSKDPTIQSLMIARWILNGGAKGWSHGGDDQDGIEYSAAFPDLTAYVHSLSSKSRYWVGPLAGVNYWKTFVTVFRGDITPASAEGKWLVQRALAAVYDRTRPDFSSWPTCPDHGWMLAAGVGLVGIGMTLAMGQEPKK